MDPNEYDNLLATLVASFSNINSEIIVISLIVLAAIVFALRRELALLDVITLGKDQAIPALWRRLLNCSLTHRSMIMRWCCPGMT